MNELTLPETNNRGLDAIATANATAIITSADYSRADAFCVSLRELEKEVDLAYDEHIAQAFQAHRSLVAKKKKYAEPIGEARTIIKTKMDAWRKEQERLRQELEAKAIALAKYQAESEVLMAAQEAEKAGDNAAAQAIIEAPVMIPAIEVQSNIPKSKTVIRQAWSAVITNAALIPDAYWIVDEAKLNALARATKGPSTIPGVEFVSRSV